MKPMKQLVTDAGGLSRQALPGDGPLLNIAPTNLTTAGAGTLPAGLLGTGLLVRTGPGAAYADTIDTGANIDTAYPNMAVGDCLSLHYSNNVAFASTITAAAGITLVTAGANNVVPASTTVILHLQKTGVGAYNLYVLG